MSDRKLKCPKCGGDQYCPCPACTERERQSIVWINKGDLVACGHCGHTMHVNKWLMEEYNQFEDIIKDNIAKAKRGE